MVPQTWCLAPSSVWGSSAPVMMVPGTALAWHRSGIWIMPRTRPIARWRNFDSSWDSTSPASQPTFALVLIGDEYLLGQLRLRNHRALCSRLGAHHLLTPWALEEIQTYLKTGLEAVGINWSRVFEPAAVDLLVRATAECRAALASWLGRPG